MASRIDQAILYQTQISFTEWFEGIKHKDTSKMRKEDNDKRDRLAILNEIVNLPFDKPTQFPANILINQTAEFKKFLQKRGSELCALRLIPIDEKLPKLRLRGITIINS